MSRRSEFDISAYYIPSNSCICENYAHPDRRPPELRKIGKCWIGHELLNHPDPNTRWCRSYMSDPWPLIRQAKAQVDSSSYRHLVTTGKQELEADLVSTLSLPHDFDRLRRETIVDEVWYGRGDEFRALYENLANAKRADHYAREVFHYVRTEWVRTRSKPHDLQFAYYLATKRLAFRVCDDENRSDDESE